MAHDGERRRSR